MKLKTTLLITAITFSSLAIAGPGRHAPHSDRIAEKLELTQSQKELFEKTMKNKKEKMKAAMEVIHEETKAELATFLTEEQLEKMEKHMIKRKKRMEHKKEHKRMKRFAPEHEH